MLSQQNTTHKYFIVEQLQLTFLKSLQKALANLTIFLGISVEKRRKTGPAGLREGYSLDFWEYPVDILLSGKLVLFFFLFFTDIPRIIIRLARAFGCSLTTILKQKTIMQFTIYISLHHIHKFQQTFSLPLN